MPDNPKKSTPSHVGGRATFKPAPLAPEDNEVDETGEFTYFLKDFVPGQVPTGPQIEERTPASAESKRTILRHQKRRFIGQAPMRAMLGTSRFFCPHCNMEGSYTHYAVKWCFCVGGVAVLTLNHLCEYVECHSCLSTFDLTVLDGESRTRGIEPLHLFASKRVMILMMLADGVIDDAEVRSIAEVYHAIGGPKISETMVRTEIGLAVAARKELIPFLESICNRLNEQGKLTVFRSAYAVAAADGEFQEEERELMYLLMNALHLKEDPFKTLQLDQM